MKSIKIVDATIRESVEKSDYEMSFKEKLEVARLMDRLEVDVIELPRITNIKTDTLLVKSIASVVNNSVVSCVAGNTVSEIENTWKAVSINKHARLHIMVPTSPVQMEYIYGKKPKQVAVLVGELVKKAASLSNDVEFSAVDATRSEKEFLAQIIETAIECGAKTVNLCDSAGVMLPNEYIDFIEDMKKRVPALNDVVISAECADDLSMADANAFCAAVNGAEQIKTTIGGWNSPSLEAVVYAITRKGDDFGVGCRVKTVQMQKAIQQLAWLTGNKKDNQNVFGTATTEENTDSIRLDKDSEMSEVIEAVKSLGYDLSDEDYAKVYESVQRVGRKKIVENKELEAIIATSSLQVPPTYTLIDYVINSGNIITATASITVEKNGNRLNGLATGDGPIEAALHAIEQIIGHHYELDDFQIRSVTEGSAAMGSTLIRLRSDGKLYSGSGVSTDIIGASIRAYINALNKIVYEGEE